jgi:hypothetical protein
VEDVQFEAPLKFYRNEPRTLIWQAVVTPEKDGLVAHITLESTRQLKTGQQHALHFSGRVHMRPVSADAAARAPTSLAAAEVPEPDAPAVEPGDIYRVYFHGPAFQVLARVQGDGTRLLGKMKSDLPSITAREKQIMTWPRLIELCLQTAGVWEIGKTGTLALPTAIEQITIHQARQNGNQANDIHPVYAEIHPTADNQQEQEQAPSTGQRFRFDARVVDKEGNVYLELRGYRTARLPAPIGDDLIAPMRKLVGGCGYSPSSDADS